MVDQSRASTLALFSKPTPVELDIFARGVVPLLGGGIVNPFGPTLQLTALIGEWKAGTKMPIVQATLNPFSQKVVEIGSFDLRELIDPVSTIQAVIPANPGGCPTALLVSPLLAHRPDDVVSIAARYLAACDSGPTTLAGVKRFPGDPKARVKHEIDKAMKDMLKRKQVGNPDDQEEKRLATEEALDLARTQLQKHNWVEEWRGFIICWSESIVHQQETGIARSALPFDRIHPLLSEVVDLSNAVLKDTFPEWRVRSES